ncbi:hypothetical protein ACFE04_016302 [Oxalis oulophora]
MEVNMMTTTDGENFDANSKTLNNWPQHNHNLPGVKQSIQHLLKVVEEDGKQVLDKGETELHSGKDQMVAHIQEFHRLFRSLAHQFHGTDHDTQSDQLIPVLHENGNSPAPLSSASGFSFKEGSQSYSSFSSESDSESDDVVSTLKINVLNSKVANNGNYEELLEKVVKYKEELNVLNHKFHLSGEENDRMNSELEKANTQLKSAQQEIDAKEAELELERYEVVNLKKKISDLETLTSDSDLKVANLIAELERSRASFQVSKDEIQVLNTKLGSEKRLVSELNEEIAKYKMNLSDTHTNFSETKARLQSEISSLSENCALLGARVVELESQGRCLKDKLRQSEASEMEMKSLHDNKESVMLSEINQLKDDLGNKGKYLEILNKDFDKHKLKFDTLMAEKDEFKAKIDTLNAEASNRNNTIMQMEEHLKQLNAENGEEKKLISKLKVRVEELEKEVELQKSMILDGAEQKREAIRQLCFSLDHYRSGYKELKEAFRGNRGYKRQALMAA